MHGNNPSEIEKMKPRLWMAADLQCNAGPSGIELTAGMNMPLPLSSDLLICTV
jgi:hypothetical protein